MNIALCYSHHARCGPHYYRRALRQLGHTVTSVGPWTGESFGTRGREPDRQLDLREPRHYDWSELGLTATPDAFFLIEGGEDLRVASVPCRWAHISTEGTHMDWSRTPHKFAEIMCNGADSATVRWLPKAFDAAEHTYPQDAYTSREYDFVQCASARGARRQVWRTIEETAPDLHVVFGDIWGPLYAATYQNALATYVCSTLDFVTTRVFEAMAMGCVCFADRTTSMLSLFEDGVHFIGYDIVQRVNGEGVPDVRWLIDQVRRLRNGIGERIARRAAERVWQRDSYQHRMTTVLEAVMR